MKKSWDFLFILILVYFLCFTPYNTYLCLYIWFHSTTSFTIKAMYWFYCFPVLCTLFMLQNLCKLCQGRKKVEILFYYVPPGYRIIKKVYKAWLTLNDLKLKGVRVRIKRGYRDKQNLKRVR